MAEPGPEASREELLEVSRAALGAAIAAASPTTYVPWQECALLMDDFLVCRLLDIVVHADDLAASVGRATPAFDPESSTRSWRCWPRCRYAATGRTGWSGRSPGHEAPTGRSRRSVSRASRRARSPPR